MLRIFIGYDSKESVAFSVLSHSLIRHASLPISITPLVRHSLYGIHSRKRDISESTDFSITRFLVPYLCQYYGIALYMDCDMLVQTDIYDLLKFVYRDMTPYEIDKYAPPWAVAVCKHDYIPKTTIKMDGQVQAAYPRKNWSSMMIFNTDRCRALTPEYVNTATGSELHQFRWTRDDQILSLPLSWNHLVGEYPPDPSAHVFHYTLGIPTMPGYGFCDHSEVWWEQYKIMLNTCHD
jgi:hypothetical protein